MLRRLSAGECLRCIDFSASAFTDLMMNLRLALFEVVQGSAQQGLVVQIFKKGVDFLSRGSAVPVTQSY